MPKKVTETEAVPLRLPVAMIEGIDYAIKIGQGSNRSDVIKTAIANYLRELNIINELKKRKL